MIIRKKKGFLRSYRDTILCTVFILSFAVYPKTAMRYNLPPAFEQTDVLRGTIIRAQRDHSHILLMLPDGQVQKLDFPGDLQGAYAGIWDTFTGVTSQEFLLLKGCAAEIRVDYLRRLGILTNPRIWDLQCDKFSISYEELVRYYNNKTDYAIIDFIYFLTLFAALALVIKIDIKESKN